MLSTLLLVVATSYPLSPPCHVQCNYMSTQMVFQMGLIWQNVPQTLVYAVLFKRPAPCWPFGFPHHSLAWEWGSGEDLGSAERPMGECPVVGEAHLMLHLSHHLMVRVSRCSSQFATDVGVAPLWVTVRCITLMCHALHTTWGHNRPLGTHSTVPRWPPLSLLWQEGRHQPHIEVKGDVYCLTT